jgi:DNA-binding response OmpR family regulator
MAKILLIDDELSIRGLLATLLERKGHTVLLADSGRKGLMLYKQERPDAIVLDLKMPEMDGLAVLRELRAAGMDKPVIILTGAGNEESESQARLLGAAAFIEKQFSLHELGDTLKRLL